MKAKRRKAFINGKIFTSDRHNLYAEAMLVEDGAIAWIGRGADLPACDYEIVDLKGRRVLPGFVDAHMHPVMLAEFSKKISSLPPKVKSIADLAAEIKKVREKQGPDRWIEGWGYDEGKLAERRSPDGYDLDKGCSDAPVSIIRTCGHIRCVNSKALEVAGIDRNTPDPQGGEIERDENGEPTGILRENARNLVIPYIPSATGEETAGALAELGELLLSQGVTAIADMGNLDQKDNYGYYMDAVKRGFKQKVAVYYMWEYYAGDANFRIPAERFEKDRQIRVAGLKLIGDGSVSGRTAWVNEPYLGTKDEYGLPVCSEALFDSAIAFCKENHCQLSMHTMGGRAIERAVDRVCGEEKWTSGDTPHLRLEHVTEPSAEAVAKTVEKGFAIATQPIFLYAEIESYLTNLGAVRMKKTYPIKTMLEQNVKLCLSTDAPATAWALPSDPFPCIKGAVTRKAYDGADCGQEQRVDVETAVMLYTANGAMVAGFEKIGALKLGYWADFIVLSEDILNVDPEVIDRICVEETYIDGDKVYEKR